MIASSILGLWLFSGLSYQGQEIPKPNPALQISYRFEDTGINTLHYQRDGEEGFCERRAIFEFSGLQLAQQVIWVHPKNAEWCAQDLDMRLGYKSWSQAWIAEGKFHLAVMMGEESLIYIWNRIE